MMEIQEDKTGDLKAIQEEDDDHDDGPLPPTPPTRLKSPTDKEHLDYLNDTTNLHLIQKEKTQVGKGMVGVGAPLSTSDGAQLNSYRQISASKPPMPPITPLRPATQVNQHQASEPQLKASSLYKDAKVAPYNPAFTPGQGPDFPAGANRTNISGFGSKASARNENMSANRSNQGSAVGSAKRRSRLGGFLQQ